MADKKKVCTQKDVAILMELATELFDAELYHAFIQEDKSNWHVKDWLKQSEQQKFEDLSLPPSVFYIYDGKWLNRNITFYVDELTAEEMTQKYLRPYLSEICACYRANVENDGRYILDLSIDDEFLGSLLGGVWWMKLQEQSRLMKIEKEAKIPTFIPYSADEWYVWIDGHLESGDLIYVVSEYVKDGFYFAFDYVGEKKVVAGWENHEHDFSAILERILDDPKHFTIKGFESDYSEQEINLINKFQQKLLQDGADAPKRVISYEVLSRLVKREVDQWNPQHLLPNAPEDEFELEAADVASQITVSSTVDEIAKVISKVFSEAFEPQAFTVERCMGVAENIWKRIQEKI